MKVYVFLAEGFEEIEAVTTIDTLRRAKIDIKAVSMSENLEVTGSRDIILKADVLFDTKQLEDAEMLILPGGMPGTTNLEKDSRLAELLKKQANENKYIAAICAAPMVLGKLGLLSGKEATCYPGFESDLEGAKVSDDKVVVDGNFITSKGPGTALEFSLKLVEILKGKELSDELRKDMIYKN